MPEGPTGWTPDIGARLAVLRSTIEKPNTDHAELQIQDLPVDCYLGMETAGSIWLRITCDPSTVAIDDQAAAVRFTVLTDGYKVTIAPTAAESVTDHLLEEMVQLLGDEHEPGDVGRTALQHWRDLLARPAGSPLTDNALVGLFGELEVLETILRHGGHLDQWTGWDKDHCDFRLSKLVVEVKSTTSANYRRVQIHGLGQLADPEDGSDLILVLKRLEPSPDGRSVPDLIDAIVRLGASRSVLLNRLSQVRYSEQHRASYEHSKFVSLEVALRDVDSSHPRLVPSMLVGVDMSCIDKVDYELNLNGDAEADLDTDLESLLASHLGKS